MKDIVYEKHEVMIGEIICLVSKRSMGTPLLLMMKNAILLDMCMCCQNVNFEFTGWM